MTGPPSPSRPPDLTLEGGEHCGGQSPYEIGGKLNEVKQGGALAPGTPPLSRYASLPPYFAGGILQREGKLLGPPPLPHPISLL